MRITLLVILACTAPAVCAGDVAEIQSAMKARFDSIRDVYVEYRCTTTGATDGEYTRHVYAAKGKNRFCENVHFYRSIPERYDLNHHKTWLTDRGLDLFNEQTRWFECSKQLADSESALKVQAPVIVEILGWWPPGDRIPQRHLFTFPIPFVFTKKNFQCVGREDVDGAACEVLEAEDGEKLWIDPGMGFALRRRIIPGEGFAVEYRLGEFQQVADDAYLPRLGRRISHRITPQGLSAGLDSTYQLTELRVNSLEDEFFEFTPPPGTLIEFMDEQRREQVPGGIEVLDNVIRATQVNLAAANRGRQSEGKPMSSTLVAVGTTCILLTLLAVLFWRMPVGKLGGIVPKD